jgi:hypothetical protein
MLKSPIQKAEDARQRAMTNRLLFVVAALASVLTCVLIQRFFWMRWPTPGNEANEPALNSLTRTFEIMDEPPPDSVALADTPFIQDQESLQNPLGVLVTLAMVVVAAVLCGVAIFLSLWSAVNRRRRREKESRLALPAPSAPEKIASAPAPPPQSRSSRPGSVQLLIFADARPNRYAGSSAERLREPRQRIATGNGVLIGERRQER